MNYVTILDWMRSDLELKGNELIIFAIIYGATQDLESEYSGGTKYLSWWCNITERAVRNILNNLEDMEIIERIEREVKGTVYSNFRCSFSGPGKNFHPVEKISTPRKKMQESGKNFHPPEKSSHNIYNNNYINNIQVKEEEIIKETRGKKFRAPSVEEVREYCEERGNSIDPEKFVNSYASKGWKVGRSPMKDWKAAVRTWEKNDKEFKKEKEARTARNSFNPGSASDLFTNYVTGQKNN